MADAHWFDSLKEKYAAEYAASPIKVSLIAYTAQPFDIAAASARTCYSSKGLLLPDDMHKSDKSRELAKKVARATLKSGHHTTRQHAQFVFGLENVSRQVIWQILHAHPYYNSEQVSQRYVAIKNDRTWYSLPTSLMQNADVHALHTLAFDTYTRLIDVLKPVVEEIYFSIHRLKARNKEEHAGDIKKRCMEIARYVMPVSTVAYLYHSVSALTLMRYARMLLWSAHEEFVVLGLKMFEHIRAIDAELFNELPVPLEPPARTFDSTAAKQKNAAFDAALQGKPARLVSSSVAALEQFDRSVFDTAVNPLLGDVFYPGTLDESTRLLNHVHFTFQKKLSHTADSQEQRHRTLPGSRPHLAEQISLENDYIVPSLIKKSPEATQIYLDYLEQNFEIVRRLWPQDSIPREDLAYLLPNAYPIRYLESGDYYNFFHKWKARLCYNAQEEIFYSAHAEVSAVKTQFPEIGKFIGPPCFVREHLKPRCPEGDHFCGIKVWQIPFNEYERVI
ncbi:MAG: FAD-dependent thymidylate synthase [Spirochaetes bacterium]|nr:FAD-dependent thymidylate synthase [Spirochaetota bacterium]